MIARLCTAPGCGQLVKKGGGACPKHTPPPKQAHQRYNNAAWKRLSKAARQAQPWCSFCGVSYDLTLDHVEAGKDTGGYLVLCRSCNSSKGNRTLKEALARLEHPSNRAKGLDP